MTLFDIIVAVVLSLSFLYSLFKGMVREVFSLAGYLFGYILAINFQDSLAEVMKDVVTHPLAARIVAFVIIFFGVKIGFVLLGGLIRRFMKAAPVLSLPDRILGGVLGLAKGLVILVIIMFPLSLFEDTYKKATQGSVLAPYLERVIQTVSRELKDRKFLDRLPDISVKDIKEKLVQMKNLNKLTKELKEPKDKFTDAANGKPQENYTEEDKQKLDELFNMLKKE